MGRLLQQTAGRGGGFEGGEASMTEDAEKLKQMLADTVVLIAGLLGDEAARAVLQDEITRLKRSRPRGRPKKGANFTTAVGLLGRTEKRRCALRNLR